jgi:hypothetical protein
MDSLARTRLAIPVVGAALIVGLAVGGGLMLLHRDVLVLTAHVAAIRELDASTNAKLQALIREAQSNDSEGTFSAGGAPPSPPAPRRAASP